MAHTNNNNNNNICAKFVSNHLTKVAQNVELSITAANPIRKKTGKTTGYSADNINNNNNNKITNSGAAEKLKALKMVY